MVRHMSFQETRARAFFRPILVGQVVSLLLLGAVFSIAGFLGADVVHLNRRPVHGPMALAVGSAVSVILSLVLAPLCAGFVCLGLWIFSSFRPLKIRVISPEALSQSFEVDGSANEE